MEREVVRAERMVIVDVYDDDQVCVEELGENYIVHEGDYVLSARKDMDAIEEDAKFYMADMEEIMFCYGAVVVRDYSRNIAETIKFFYDEERLVSYVERLGGEL